MKGRVMPIKNPKKISKRVSKKVMGGNVGSTIMTLFGTLTVKDRWAVFTNIAQVVAKGV